MNRIVSGVFSTLVFVIVIIFCVSSQIDAFAIQDIDDASLACYIPLYGDRIATRRYCMDKQKRKENEPLRMSLLDKLRKRMRTGATSHGDHQNQELPLLG